MGGGPKGVTSLISTGPIAATVADALLMYAVIANAGCAQLLPLFGYMHAASSMPHLL